MLRTSWSKGACGLLLALACACAGDEARPSDRTVVVAEPIDPASEVEGERFLGAIEFVLARVDQRRIGPTPLQPDRDGAPGRPVIVEFEAEGLQDATGRLGLLPPRGAARQEVAFDTPGQPEDPRSVWIDVTITSDGPQRFELPPPGPHWHADWAVVALELRRGRTPVPVIAGPRSEMLSDGTRALGGRAILGVVPVERRPTRVLARALGDDEAPTLDGALDEAIWQREGAVLVHSRTGEPADDIDAKLGGATEVWFAWDREHLYVAASLPDRDLYAPHQNRDDPLYRDEAFEVFIAGDASGKNYLEHQVSPRNVQFDARFPQYRKGDEQWDGTWRSAVQLDGELERRGGDRRWTVELAFSWAELCKRSSVRCPPKPDMTLRVNVFRLDKPDRRTQVGLALSPTIEPDFHAWKNAAELVLEAPEE
ncbi:MAG TPA: carbohydrate-binding family 9-like protein [Enhygromyxa sp.]|nr:carbohydrate-binding family 9-like protein [Enhygromyxa sp.]